MRTSYTPGFGGSLCGQSTGELELSNLKICGPPRFDNSFGDRCDRVLMAVGPEGRTEKT
jgi:hypothetical protein